MIPLDAKLSRCYGYGCNLKWQCDRYLTIAQDKKGGLYAYSSKLNKNPPNDKVADCYHYINDLEP
jgi:hypothetical protein